MIKLIINQPEFAIDINKPEIQKALAIEFESIKMYEYYYNTFKNDLFKQILTHKKQLEQIFSSDDEIMFVECSIKEAYIMLLACELKLVQAYKLACLKCENEQFKDLLYRLWASSVNEYQLALKQSLAANNQGIDSLVNSFLKDILK